MSVPDSTVHRFVADRRRIQRSRWILSAVGAGLGLLLLGFGLASDAGVRTFTEPVGGALFVIGVGFWVSGAITLRRPSTLEVRADGLAVQYPPGPVHFVAWNDMTDVRVRRVAWSAVLELGLQEGAQVTYGKSIPRPCPDDPSHLRFYVLYYLGDRREECLAAIEAAAPVPVLRLDLPG